MATKTVNKYFDDIDGKEIQEKDHGAVEIRINDTIYRLDLAPHNVRRFKDAAAEFLRAADVTLPKVPEPKASVVRDWAQKNNIEVNEMGRIPKEIMDKYKAANAPQRD